METIGSLLDIPRNIPKQEFLVEQLLIPTFGVPEFEFVCEIVGPDDPWYHDIYTYLRIGVFLIDITLNLKINFFKKLSHFVILGDTLYHRIIEGTLL